MGSNDIALGSQSADSHVLVLESHSWCRWEPPSRILRPGSGRTGSEVPTAPSVGTRKGRPCVEQPPRRFEATHASINRTQPSAARELPRMAPDGPLSVCVACSCRTVRTLIPEARKQMIEPPATMPREGGSDTTRWWFCLVMAHLRPDDPWRLPPPSLMAPNGNIAGPEWQYRVAHKPPNTHEQSTSLISRGTKCAPICISRDSQTHQDRSSGTAKRNRICGAAIWAGCRRQLGIAELTIHNLGVVSLW